MFWTISERNTYQKLKNIFNSQKSGTGGGNMSYPQIGSICTTRKFPHCSNVSCKIPSRMKEYQKYQKPNFCYFVPNCKIGAVFMTRYLEKEFNSLICMRNIYGYNILFCTEVDANFQLINRHD